jgi:hypothetical protein
MATIVPMMSIWEIANCVTTNILLNEIPPILADVILLFKANAGLKPDTTNAG